MKKWIAAAALAVAALGSLAGPAQAGRANDYDRRNRYDVRENRLESRDRQIRSRAERLYDDRKISRSERDRAIDRLDDIRRDFRSGSTVDADDYRNNQRRLDSLERSLNGWSNGVYKYRWGLNGSSW